MLPRLNQYFSSTLAWKSCLSSLTKIPSLFINNYFHNYHFPVHSRALNINHLRKNAVSRSLNNVTPALTKLQKSVVARKQKIRLRLDSPEGKLKRKLDECSKHGRIIEALQLYDEAKRNGVRLYQYHYNCLLYLCSSCAVAVLSCDSEWDLGWRRGFEIFREMKSNGVIPNEATFTNMARLASRIEDPEMAFDMVKEMKNHGVAPKLRSYEAALHGFCRKGEADRAYEVDAHMCEHGVMIDEPGISALLKVSSDLKQTDKVYEMLHRLRCTVRQVEESSAMVVENWFKSGAAEEVGEDNWDAEKVRHGVQKGGGGWHGYGWLGSGKWNVVRSGIDKTGMCYSCGERLACIDLDPLETENFASSLSNLACRKEKKANFKGLQEWLERHGPFDAIIDGANAGLLNQPSFSFFQLKSVVNEVRQMSSSKKHPLIILHRNRVFGSPALIAKNKEELRGWEKSGVLYVTPAGSNDDWYWLYAAVSLNCLLVTNDEMRDHLFELLGSSFFSKWKEKHQVRFSFLRNRPVLHRPPIYSIVTQESETGSWHMPTVLGDDIETPRQWVCATRAQARSRASSQAITKTKSLTSLFRGRSRRAVLGFESNQ